MVKRYIITFSISVLISFSLCVIMLMIMVPQQQVSVSGSVQEYQKVDTNDYKFVQTKNISKESLMKEYTISDVDLATFKKANQYQAGNSDPFTPASDLTTVSNSNNQTTATNNTTNSNGGTQNPTSTAK